MLSRYLLPGMFVLALASALTGCSKSTTAPIIPPTEQSQVTTVLTQATPLIDDDVTGTETQAFGMRPAGSDAAETAITPLYFWRRIDSVTRSYEFAFSDSDSTGRPRQVLVTIRKHLLGAFNVIASTDSVNVIHKPLDETWTRVVQLVRLRAPTDSTRTVWRIRAVSGASMLSTGAVTRIQSLRIVTTGLDTTLTDPLAALALRRTLSFPPSDSVRLTVTMLVNNDVVVLHHRDHRRLFRNNGDNTYTLAFVTGAFPGWRHFGVDAIAHASLFDDAAAYDANRWHIPFKIQSEVPVDYYP